MGLFERNESIAIEAGVKPENLKRVEEMTGKTLSFHNVDLNNLVELQNLFKQVIFFTFNLSSL